MNNTSDYKAIYEAVERLTPDTRVSAIVRLLDAFCRHCGARTHLPCYCEGAIADRHKDKQPERNAER
jgi:hypothetical protein